MTAHLLSKSRVGCVRYSAALILACVLGACSVVEPRTRSAPQAGSSAGPSQAGSTSNADALITPSAGSVDAGSTRSEDSDGFSVAEGDCNDFEDAINPGAYDVPGNGIDEDCDGTDATSDTCDADLDIAANDPLMAARAIDLCNTATDNDRRWGVISARWTTPDGQGEPGSDLLHGLLPSFGPSYTPRQGKTLLALSSGVARAKGQPDATAECSDFLDPPTSSSLPEGFDRRASGCDFSDEALELGDAVALELKLRVPTNVAAISFDSAFFTTEFPNLLCSSSNDIFQVLVTPKRVGSGSEGNVVFDLDGNPVSVNNSLLRVCAPGEYNGKRFACPLGPASLVGTGVDECACDQFSFCAVFGDNMSGAQGASTGWISTQLAVQPGEVITMRFAIWDSGDSQRDSLSIIDHVRFTLKSQPPPPETPTTTPVSPD